MNKQFDLSKPPIPIPEWLDAPDSEVDPDAVTLWCCFGEDLFEGFSAVSKTLWIHLFATKEEAEAKASTPNKNWKWNREPANPQTLSWAMDKARRGGLAGVCIFAYRNGKWGTVRKFPAGVPLQGRREP